MRIRIDPPQHRRPGPRRGGVPHRLLLPLAGAGLLIACGVALLVGPRETHTVSHVVGTVRDIALASNEPGAPPDAGFLGPWKINAQDVDPSSGMLVNFRVESGPMIIAARRARIVVDPEADTFGFELWNVSFVRVPDPKHDDRPAGVHEMDHYVLGPAPYGVDIVPDGVGSIDPLPPPSKDSPLTRAEEAMGREHD